MIACDAYVRNAWFFSGRVDEAVREQKKYCDSGVPSSCEFLGREYSFGRILTRDLGQSRYYYGLACEIDPVAYRRSCDLSR